MRRRNAVLVAVVMALASLACSSPPPPPPETMVLVVRHAEKLDESANPPLTDAGKARAEALVEVASAAGVTAIYSSQFQRNLDTVAPLASRAGVSVVEVPVDLNAPGDYGARLAERVVKEHPGGTVVVVSHQNTVASIVEGLTGRKEAIPTVAYDDLFVVTVGGGRAPRLVHARYGPPAG